MAPIRACRYGQVEIEMMYLLNGFGTLDPTHMRQVRERARPYSYHTSTRART